MNENTKNDYGRISSDQWTLSVQKPKNLLQRQAARQKQKETGGDGQNRSYRKVVLVKNHIFTRKCLCKIVGIGWISFQLHVSKIHCCGFLAVATKSASSFRWLGLWVKYVIKLRGQRPATLPIAELFKLILIAVFSVRKTYNPFRFVHKLSNENQW